jgi:hypothetical protein
LKKAKPVSMETMEPVGKDLTPDGTDFTDGIIRKAKTALNR